MSCDLKDLFLASPMDKLDYTKVPIKYFPPDIIERYHLKHLVDSREYTFVRANKDMCGLKQAVILAFQQFAEILETAG